MGVSTQDTKASAAGELASARTQTAELSEQLRQLEKSAALAQTYRRQLQEERASAAAAESLRRRVAELEAALAAEKAAGKEEAAAETSAAGELARAWGRAEELEAALEAAEKRERELRRDVELLRESGDVGSVGV